MPSPDIASRCTGKTASHPLGEPSAPQESLVLPCCGVPLWLSDEERQGFCRGTGLVAALASSIAVCAIAVLWANDLLPL